MEFTSVSGVGNEVDALFAEKVNAGWKLCLITTVMLTAPTGGDPRGVRLMHTGFFMKWGAPAAPEHQVPVETAPDKK